MADVEDTALTENASPPSTGRLKGDILYRHWAGKGPVKAVILLAHGLGEHCARYQHFADYFTARGISLVALDHIGHGESPGHRAHVTSFEDYLQPLDELRDNITQWYPGAPCFLVGHSMGGLIAACYLLVHQDRLAGAALSAGALQVPDSVSPFALGLNRFLSWCWPTLGMLQLDPSQISRDPKVVQDYLDDPLIHKGKISARLVAELFRNMTLVQDNAAEITLPLLIMHGDADAMATCEGSKSFYGKAGASDKTLKLYPQLYHEIFNEPEKLEVMGDLARWIESRI